MLGTFPVLISDYSGISSMQQAAGVNSCLLVKSRFLDRSVHCTALVNSQI